MLGMGPAELLLLLFFSSGGNMPDAVSLVPARDYFKIREIEATPAKLMELASQEPATAKKQIQQLMALRLLAETPKLDPAAVKVLRDIAEGKKGKDSSGFAQEHAQRALASLEGKGQPALPKVRAVEGLEWFPEDASVVGVVDFRLGRIPGLRSAAPEPALWKIIPAKLKKRMLEQVFDILESTGNVEIHRGAIALADGKRGLEDPRIYARFTGKFNQEWVVSTLKNKTPLTFEAGKGPGGETYQFGRVEREDMILTFLSNEEVILTGSPDRGAGHGLDLLKDMLEIKGKKKASVRDGKLLKPLLAKVPADAVGMLVMDMTRDEKAFAVFPFIFGVPQPDQFILFAAPELKALDLQLEVVMKNEGDAAALVKSISRMREEGIRELKMLGGMGLPPGFSAAPFIQLLESLQFEGKGSSAKVRLLLSEDLVREMVNMMLRSIPADLFEDRPDLPPPGKEEKEAPKGGGMRRAG